MSDFFDEFNDSTKAKLGVYRAYIARYLKVLSKAYQQSWNRNKKDTVYIADLFAGPGKDERGNPGSPMILLDYLAQTYLEGLQVKICFNESDPENHRKLKAFVDNHRIQKINWVETDVQNKDYADLLPQILSKHKTHNYFKRFFFIDPFGYSGIRLADMKEILKDGDTEVLLFLPVSFIYRFKGRMINAIRTFLDDFILVPDVSVIENDVDFARNILERLRKELGVFVDSFIIQDDAGRGHNCLIYCSSNRKGLEKFVETKWEIDEDEGAGFVKCNVGQTSFLQEFFSDSLKIKMREFLEDGPKTNVDIRDFCYEIGSLPRHGTDVLKFFAEQDLIRIRAYNADTRIRKNTFYLSDGKNAKVAIELVK